MTTFNWLIFAAAILALAASGLAQLASMQWAATTRELTERLRSGRPPPWPARYDPQELEGLPAPVQRYFRRVLAPGQAIVAGATVEQRGQLNLSDATAQWVPFSSRQTINARQRGFLWDARIALMPGFGMRVHDGYVERAGLIRASVLSLFKVVDLHGGGELARGELMRFFAEAAWYPTALLPSQGVRRAAVDTRSARATLTDGPICLTLLFRFDDAGTMTSVRAEARGRLEGRKINFVPWEVRWSDLQRHDGMLVPMTSELAWILPDGPRPYWRGTITKLSYRWTTGGPKVAVAALRDLGATRQDTLEPSVATMTSALDGLVRGLSPPARDARGPSPATRPSALDGLVRGLSPPARDARGPSPATRPTAVDGLVRGLSGRNGRWRPGGGP